MNNYTLAVLRTVCRAQKPFRTTHKVNLSNLYARTLFTSKLHSRSKKNSQNFDGIGANKTEQFNANSCRHKFFSTSSASCQTNPSSGEQQSNSTVLLTYPCDHVAHIELNAPQSKNAFSLATAKELIATLDLLESNPTVRCVVMSGNGPDFTSGVDIKNFFGFYQKLQQIDDIARRAKTLRVLIEQFQEPFKRLQSFEKPVICVAHGLSIGLGMELAACSDIRYCSKDAKFAIREVAVGLAADVGSLQLMPHLTSNQSLLRELIYTGRYLTLDEIQNLSFVSHIGETKDDTLRSALELASTIAQKSPVAVQGSKKNLNFSHDKPFHVGLEYNAIWNAAMMQGGDIGKAVGAILSREDDVKFDDL